MTEQKNVLIIDDDKRNIFALSAVLKARGFVVVSAASASEGIGMLHTNKGINVVLLDMMMPDMDGYEALAEIRNTASLRHIPVIAVTAQAMVGDREKCLEAGADDYVSKPVDVDQLYRILQAYK